MYMYRDNRYYCASTISTIEGLCGGSWFKSRALPFWGFSFSSLKRLIHLSVTALEIDFTIKNPSIFKSIKGSLKSRDGYIPILHALGNVHTQVPQSTCYSGVELDPFRFWGGVSDWERGIQNCRIFLIDPVRDAERYTHITKKSVNRTSFRGKDTHMYL